MSFAAEIQTLSPWEPGILSLFLYVIIVVGIIGLLLFIIFWLGDKRKSLEKARAYECGIIPSGSARFRYPIPFYLVAVFFLIFDVEAAYIFAWAVAFDDLGWSGWLRISFFIFILFLSLIYIWVKGELDWKPTSSKKEQKTTS